MSYSVNGYQTMVRDPIRMRAYEQALQRTVSPGDVVLDLGTGTGIHAMIACRLGAAHVFAIETSDMVAIARQNFHANGMGDRVTVIQQDSARVTLPQPADVVVSDLRGILPYYGRHIPSIVDVRARMLKPDGHLIPLRDSVFLAVADYCETQRDSGATEVCSPESLGFDWQAVHRCTANSPRKAIAGMESLVSSAAQCATLDYRTIDSPDLTCEVATQVVRSGSANGLLVWFDTELAADCGFSNAPGNPEAIYGKQFFPFVTSIEVEVGQTLTVRLSASLIGDDYIWTWMVLDDVGRPRTPKQSSFFAIPLSADTLRRREAAHIPTLNRDGQIDCFVVRHFGIGKSLAGIASLLQAEFPTEFPSGRDAMARVIQLSLRYSS